MKHPDPDATKLAKLLRQLNDGMWNFEADFPGVRMGWTDKEMLYATKVFATVLLDRTYDYHQFKSDMTEKQLQNHAEECGRVIRTMVEATTGIDLGKAIVKDLDERPEV